MRLVPFYESLYSDLAFAYHDPSKSYVARTGRETITITPGYGPFDGYFKVSIDDDSGNIFECSELSLNGNELNDAILDEVASIISSTYLEFVDVDSISDLYHAYDKFDHKLSRELRNRF